MTTIDKHIRDLIHFYVKTNYEHYIKDNNIEFIPNEDIESVISKIYDSRKEHLKEFIKSSLKTMLKEECPNDLVILNILSDIFNDDALCRNRLVLEITLYQNDKRGITTNYKKI